MGGIFCKCCQDEEGSNWQWHTAFQDEHRTDTNHGSTIEPLPEILYKRSESSFASTDSSSITAAIRAVDYEPKRRLSLQPASMMNLLDHDALSLAESPLPHTPPMIVASRHSSLLQPLHLAELRRALPRSLRECAWQKSFCLSHSGASLSRMNLKVCEEQAVVIVVRINDGTLVGAVVVCPGKGWMCPPAKTGESIAFGNSDSFLFSLPASACSSLVKPKLLGHRTSVRGRHNHHHSNSSTWTNGSCSHRHIIPEAHIYRPLDIDSKFVVSNSSQISFAKDGLWLEADLAQGGSATSRRFGLGSPLCKDKFFDILALEAWVLLHN